MSLEVLFPHDITYNVKDRATVEEVISSLVGTQLAVEELQNFLPQIFAGLEVESAKLLVRDISHGSLREAFYVALLLVYQDELKQEIPAMVEKWLGVDVPASYDAVLTVAMLLFFYYGAEYVCKNTLEKKGSLKLREQIDYLVMELSEHANVSETRIRHVLSEQFKKPGKAISMGKAAISVFSPSRRQNNASVTFGGKDVPSEVIAELPTSLRADELAEQTRIKELPGVHVEITRKDKYSTKVGWMGKVRTISDRSFPLRFYPTLDHSPLWDLDELKADVIVHYKLVKDDFEPFMVELIEVVEPE